jgi:hypothetical protein
MLKHFYAKQEMYVILKFFLYSLPPTDHKILLNLPSFPPAPVTALIQFHSFAWTIAMVL